MENLFQEAKNLIADSKNIYILSLPEREEGVTCALALFYTLKELDKNVNLVIDEMPERLKFLTPSLDYVSYPRNFAISIPNSKAEISQIRYEKDEKDLKVYLTIDKGNIKKNDISFCYTTPKADLVIAIGLKELNYTNQLGSLENGVLLNAPVLNIDNQEENKNFGKVNLIRQSYPLAEYLISFIKFNNENLITAPAATALLTSLIIFCDNFQNQKTSPEILERAALLIKKGAKRQEILDNLYKQK